ncbi:ComF family protein [Methylophilus medardicus]|uniref:ComF family protein n=1 Tax=Methylophilus medardicus TaxID=2588534 RepID=UPI00295003D6|nr:ComF family protein [Methylophilus medardicus]
MRIICCLKYIVKKFYNRLKFNQITPSHLLKAWLTSTLPCLLCAANTAPKARLGFTHTPICADCIAALPWYTAARCPQCALPNAAGALCGRCLQHPPAFDRTFAPFRYAYPLDRLLHQFKYHQQLFISPLLTDSLITQWPQHEDANQAAVLLAMPMHINRLRQRGFNHALLLAKQLQRHWAMPLDLEGCTRIVDTQTQAGMDMRTRVRNLRGAFTTAKQWHGKHVVVVDDVMTTGASMHAVANVLKQAGAERVTALVLARTLKDTVD